MTNTNTSSGNLVHVSNYVRDSGTHVDDYYRHKPGGGTFSEEMHVSTTASNVMKTFGNNRSFEKECPALNKLFGSISKSNASVDVPDPGAILKGGVQIIRIVLEKVVEVAKVALEVIAVAVAAATVVYEAYKAGKAVYDKVTGLFKGNEIQAASSKLKLTIKGLRDNKQY